MPRADSERAQDAAGYAALCSDSWSCDPAILQPDSRASVFDEMPHGHRGLILKTLLRRCCEGG